MDLQQKANSKRCNKPKRTNRKNKAAQILRK